MKRFIYILLCLSLAFNLQGQQAAFFQHNYTAPTGGGSACSNMNAVAYINALKAQGDPVADSNNICSLYVNLATHGLYSKIKAMGDLARGNANYNKVNMITPAGTFASYSGSPTHASNGITTNGSSQYIDPGVTMALAAQNTAGMGIYVTSTPTGSGTKYYMGGFDGTRLANLGRGSDVNILMGLNTGSGDNKSAADDGGFIFQNRTTSTLLTLTRNGTSLGTQTTATSGVTGNNIWIGGRRSSAGALQAPADATFALYLITDQMTNTEVTQLNTDIEAYMDGKGIGVQP